MEMTDDDLRRAVIGVFALTHREMNGGGSNYVSREAFDSFMALVEGYGGYRLNFEFKSDAPTPVVVELAAKQVIEEAETRLVKTLTAGAFAFADFCSLIEQEAPAIDIEGLIGRLALMAAGDQGRSDEH